MYSKCFAINSETRKCMKINKKKYHLFIKIKKNNVKYIHISHINQNLIEIVRFNCIPIHYKI